jgi:hypothetical protein
MFKIPHKYPLSHRGMVVLRAIVSVKPFDEGTLDRAPRQTDLLVDVWALLVALQETHEDKV